MNQNLPDTMKECVDDMFDEVFSSKTFLVSMYLLKYIYDSNLKYSDMFIEEFKTLNYEDQIQVLTNVKANLEENKKINKNNKTKVKKYNKNSKSK